jgi:ABC-2 type transport system ATP-binding protein
MNLLDFIREFTVSLFTTMAERAFTGLAVEIDKASFSYGNNKALDDLSLEVPAGISFGLLGPNGAGKTTLIRLLVGLLRPKSGSVQILGQKPSRKTAHLIGYMPQLHSLYSELSIIQNVDFFARIYRLTNRTERAQRVEEAIGLVDLWARRNDSVLKLSGGMKQRVNLACAIVHNPPLLLLDEPTVGLDPELRVTFWRHFNTLTQQGITLIVSSHTMDDAVHCDRLALMRDGKVIAQGAPSELQQATGQPGATLEDAFLYFIHHEARDDS